MENFSSPSFRSAGLGGFNKKDVTAYIRALSESYESEKADLEAACAKATREKEALENKNISLSRELGMLRMLKDEDRSKESSRAEELDALKAENASLREELQKAAEALDAEKAALAEALREAEEARDAEKEALAAEYRKNEEAFGLEKASLADELRKSGEALAGAEEKAAALEADKRSLSQELEKSGAVMAQLEAEKKIIADLEVEARLRAKRTEDQARERIASLVAVYQKEFTGAKDSFRSYKSSADQLIGSTSSYLKELTALFESMEKELSISESAFEKLSEDPSTDTL